LTEVISRIIVPLDGSPTAEQVLPYVRVLGRSTKARLTLLRIVEPAPPDLEGVAADGLLVPSLERRWQQAHAYLEEVATPLRQEGLVAATEVVDGEAASSILDLAERQPATLVAMSTHGRSGLARWALGSIADKVLHAATGPLLIVRAQEPEKVSPQVKLARLVVPLDGSSLAEQALPLAADLAQKLGLKLTLVQATPSVGDYLQYADSPPPSSMEDLAREADDAAMEYLAGTAQRLEREGVRKVEHYLIHGPPGTAVTDFIRETPDCLVAMTTHGYSGVGRWLLGSVADRVIRQCGAPVLVIRSTA
jgi:nucleotide-binding universal stress UspA family protein